MKSDIQIAQEAKMKNIREKQRKYMILKKTLS